MTLDLAQIARQTMKLPSDWYMGALGAAGVAASVVPAGERIAAALLAGGAVIAFGAYKTAPCCAGCAAGAGCAGASSAPPAPAVAPPRPNAVNPIALLASVTASPAAPYAAIKSYAGAPSTPIGGGRC